ncbi:MAG: pilus assembly protein TadG-related protein, partial [Acidimicrobiia bacterium]
MSSPRRKRGEDGIFLSLFALVLLALLTMVAIVLDLSALRADRRNNRAAADAAASAGANAVATSAVAACDEAWEYALANLGLDLATNPTPCGSFPPCDPLAPVTESVTTAAGRYSITIVHPVVSGDALGDELLRASAVGPDIAQPEDATADGSACQRVGVRISNNRESIFARVIGHRSHTPRGHSVARRLLEDTGLPLSLVVLEPTRCPAISSSGTGSIEVTGTGPALVGGILVVSDGTSGCSP